MALFFFSKLCIPPARKKESVDNEGGLDDNENIKENNQHTSEQTENIKDDSVCSENGTNDNKAMDRLASDANRENGAQKNGPVDGEKVQNECSESTGLENCDSNVSKADVSDRLEMMDISENAVDSAKDGNDSGLVKDTQSTAHLEKDILTEEELTELHLKADILHYLLPGLCHLTAEEEPRRLLLNSGALGVLDLYMWRQWEKLVDETRRTRETVVSLE